MVEVMGQAFFTMTKRSLSPEVDNNGTLFPPTSDFSYLNAPSTAPYNESMNENMIRECMCVFEDCAYAQLSHCVKNHGVFAKVEKF
jgi:hypothetical protein